MKRLGRLEEVPLREVWNHEQYDFSEWLAKEENLALLGEKIGLTLVDPETERFVGSYRCDIVCKDEMSGQIVLIENQLEPTNHDHLGKIITYASGLHASVVVWIVQNAREEHASAIEWLNEHVDSSVSFFLIEIHAMRIGDSDPAPMFDIIEQPNDFVVQVKKSVGGDKDSQSKAHRLDFWTRFNEVLLARGKPFSIRKPSMDHWYSLSIGSSKCNLSLDLVNKDGFIRVNMWIPDSKEQYYVFEKNKDSIEKTLGLELLWEPMEDKKGSRISCRIEGLDFDNQDNYEELMNIAIDRLIAFKAAFKPYLS